jgi:hypothetical protein
MYKSGPTVNNKIDLEALNKWLLTIDPKLIASFGLYGGEPSIDMMHFGQCLVMAKKMIGNRPGFVITNGTWSKNSDETERFLEWSKQHSLYITVSGTAEHRRYQNRQVLEELNEKYSDWIKLKPLEENFHAMGRLEGVMPFSCTTKCMSWNRALRIAVKPSGDIIFQNCNGIYPIVGNIQEPFDVIDKRIKRMRSLGFKEVCPYYKENI